MGCLVIYNVAQPTFSAIIPSLLLRTSLCSYQTPYGFQSTLCALMPCFFSTGLFSSIPSFPSFLVAPCLLIQAISMVSFSGEASHGSSWQVVGCFLPVFLLQRFSCCLVRTYFLLLPDCRLLEQDWVLLSLYPRCVAWAWHTCYQIEFFNLVPFLLKLGGKIKFTADINCNFL